MRQWLGLSDPAMQEDMHDEPLHCQFAQLGPGMSGLPDESTILRFRHLLEEHGLGLQIMAAVNQETVRAMVADSEAKPMPGPASACRAFSGRASAGGGVGRFQGKSQVGENTGFAPS